MRKIFCLVTVFAFFFVGCSQSNNEIPNDLIRSMGEQLVGEKGMPPGLSIAIMKRGKLIFSEGFGYADLEQKEQVTPKTQFRAASVSKTMTATAVAKLSQENRLDLDAPIQKYVPKYPSKQFPITARQLAGHLSGMPHYSSKDSIQNHFYNSVTESLGVFSHLDLLQEPGSEYIYSTHGYTLLSAVVEGASGESFLDYLKNELIRPLKMYDTGPDLRDGNSTNMTELYGIDEKGKPYRVENPEDPSYKWGGGGMVSTPSDLVKLGNAYLDGFIKKEVVDEAFKSQKLALGKETGVGIGWRRNWDMNKRPVFEHAGAMDGARSVLSIFPEDGLVIAIMANTYSPRNIEETAHLIALPFLRKETRVKQAQGKWDLTITINDPNGKEIKESGYLILNGEDDRIVIGSKGLDKTTYPLFYMQTGNTYALAHRYGLIHTEIEHDNNVLKGKSILYRSPRNQPPTEEKPFLSFIGKQLQEK